MDIQLAQTEKTLRAAYQIRYACLHKAFGDERHAHHESALFYDADDTEAANVFVAYVDGQAVATARLLFRKHHPFVADDFYDYAALARLFNEDIEVLQQQIGLIDRVCIVPAYRGHSIFAALFSTVVARMQQERCRYLLAAIHQNNTKSNAVFQHFGFQPLPELKQYEGWTGYLYYRVLDMDA